MRRIAPLFVLASLGASTVGRAAEPASVLVDRPSALETRPLWQRPSDGLTLQQRTEAALDRGNGRVEGEPLFQLRLLDRERAIRSGAIERNSEIDRYREEIDRAEQLERQRIRAAQARDGQVRYERESEALATQRSAWRAVVQRENATGGAVVDRQALGRVEAEYRRAIANAEHARDVAFQGAGDDRERRAAAMQNFEHAKADAIQARQRGREVILGHR